MLCTCAVYMCCVHVVCVTCVYEYVRMLSGMCFMCSAAQTGIDGMFPTSREDFEKFETAISKKILESQVSLSIMLTF